MELNCQGYDLQALGGYLQRKDGKRRLNLGKKDVSDVNFLSLYNYDGNEPM